MTDQKVVLAWFDRVIAQWLACSEPSPDSPLKGQLKSLDGALKKGDRAAVANQVRALLDIAYNRVSASDFAEILFKCAKAQAWLENWSSAQELLAGAVRNCARPHEKAIMLWMLGCVQSVEDADEARETLSRSKQELDQLYRKAQGKSAAQYKGCIEEMNRVLDKFDSPGQLPFPVQET